MVPVFIVSVAVQVLWGLLCSRLGLAGWAKYVFDAFLTAALTEELFKYAAALFVIKKAKPKRMIDYALYSAAWEWGSALRKAPSA